MNTHDRTRLPRWAQREIETLERDRDTWKNRVIAGPANSDTFVDYGGSVNRDNERPLGEGPTVLFRAGDRWIDEFSVYLRTADATHKHAELWVRGGDGLQIIPSSSNSIRVRIGR